MKKKNEISKMAPLKGDPSGRERDSKGHPIPMKLRTSEDRAKSKKARSNKPK
jgi:hypothetical protein